MDYLTDFFTNHMLLAPGFAWLTCQLLKLLINLLVEKRLILERLFGDGGMPSGHSATVSCLATVVGWECGFGSAQFAIALILAIVVMHDAMGVRRETGKHAASINELSAAVNELFRNPDKKIKTENMKLLVGHTPFQVVVGFFVGVAVGIITLVIVG